MQARPREILDTAGAAGAGLLNFLLPMRCLACDERVGSKDSLCARCWREMPFIEKPWCQRLGTPFAYDVGEETWSPAAIASPPAFDRLRTVTLYDGPARSLVLALKFSRRRELALAMGRWMSRAGNEFLDKDCLVVPVPLHRYRLWTRRFNQAADLAKVVASHCGGRFEPELLKRTRRTRQQVGLSANDRQQNVRSAFTVSRKGVEMLQGRHVVLIDDVLTTGATVTACSKTLLSGGAASVDVLTFSYADPSKGAADDWLNA